METLWALLRDSGLRTVCLLTQTGTHSWSLTIVHGPTTVLTEFFWTRDDAVAAARKIERGLIDVGWTRAASEDVATKG